MNVYRCVWIFFKSEGLFSSTSAIYEWIDCSLSSHRELLLTLVCEGCPEDTTINPLLLTQSGVFITLDINNWHT